MSRSVVAVGPVLLIVFGVPWGILMSVTKGEPLAGWLVAGLMTGLLYAVGMTLWMAFRMTEGGRKPLRVSALRVGASLTTSEPLAVVRERVAEALREVGASPHWEDDPGGFRASGTTGLIHERVEVVVRPEEAGSRVEIRSRPRWPWVLIDVQGRNEANVRRLSEAVAPAADSREPAWDAVPEGVEVAKRRARATRPQATPE